jgi:hypothetical protein
VNFESAPIGALSTVILKHSFGASAMSKIEDVQKAYRKYRSEHGTDKAVELVESFGVPNEGIDGVPESKLPELLAALQGGATGPAKLAQIGAAAFAKRKAKR